MREGEILVVRGPPGTGKSTVIIETCVELKLKIAAQQQKKATPKSQHPKILVTAPSNCAIDEVAKALDSEGISVVRITS